MGADKGNLQIIDVDVILENCPITVCVCVCVCVFFSSHSFWTSSSLDVPARVTQEDCYT